MKIINVGLIAHADAGKTTLTEQLMVAGKAVRSFGSVDKGAAQTDGLKVEQERGISVKTASAVLQFEHMKLNLIDTPGHSDFLSEVERALSVLDYAVLLVSAVEGIQAQTEVLLTAAQKMQLPLLVFINKIDRAGSRGAEVLAQLQGLFKTDGRATVALNAVAGEGEGAALTVAPDWAEELLLAVGSEAEIEDYLTAGRWEETVLFAEAALALADCRWVPVLFGSSKLSLGIDALIETLERYTLTWQSPQRDFCARVFKVDWDPVLGKGAHVRVFSGQLQSRQNVYIGRVQREEKCTVLRLPSGRKSTDIKGAEAGEIALVYGLSSVRAGDVLGHGAGRYPQVTVAHSLLSVQIIPQKEEEQPALLKAMQELCDEDPLLDYEWNIEKRELRIKISGKIQTEILQILLLERYGLAASFSAPSVIYKETPKMAGEGFDAYTMPKPCWAVLRFAIEPLPRGSGLVYESVVPNKELLYRYQNHVETAVPRALSQGLCGWEVTDLKVTLIAGQHHHVHTHPMDFFLCTPLAIMNGLLNTGTDLLEPYYSLRLSGPESCLGKTLGLLQNSRASFDTPVLENAHFSLTALAPVARCLELPTDFAALSGGRGTCGLRFSHYDLCPPGAQVQRQRIGVNPLDRAKFILEQRSALA